MPDGFGRINRVFPHTLPRRTWERPAVEPRPKRRNRKTRRDGDEEKACGDDEPGASKHIDVMA